MRKLASIQKIRELNPIDGADSIEMARVLGWQLVVKKGEYKIGDLCIFCEIDSILPDKPEFEFLRPRKMRIKTVKLRGQISQGICFPLSFLPEDTDVIEGVDVTDLLGVKKFEPPIPFCLEGKMKGRFPAFVPKTDETRVQVIIDVLANHKGEKCYITEKIDGTSVTYFIKDGDFGFCSRNLELYEDNENSFWKLAREFDIEKKLRSLNGNFALQGEVVGENIQSNPLKIRGQKVFFFNVFDINNFQYYDFKNFKKIIDLLGLESVPIVSDEYFLEPGIDLLVQLSIGKSLINNDMWREGIVIRSVSEKKMGFERFSFKVINPNFLLKYDI
jgi:RNA ligase (TIGR02306 family)